MTQPKVTMPVAAIMARRWVERGRLRIPSWRAIGVVGGDRIATATARGDLVQTVDDEQHFLWAGFTIELFRDAAQTYWENLTGESPSVFILCHETEPGQLEPSAITADQHQAIAGTESDERVFAVPIPPEIYREIERFVVEHYAPKPVRKRQRKNWSTDSET